MPRLPLEVVTLEVVKAAFQPERGRPRHNEAGSLDCSVEVVLCTYNGAAFIAEQLSSILKQSRPVDLVSIYDDASTDETVDMIHETIDAREADGSLRNAVIEMHVNSSNLGFINNFSGALAKARMDVVFLCDQDDIWEDNKVEALLMLMATSGAGMAFSDGYLIDAQARRLRGPGVLGRYGLGRKRILKFEALASRLLVRRNYINGAACAIERDLLHAALPVPAGLPHDYWIALWSAAHARIAATSEQLYAYRQHDSNVIGIGGSKWHWQLVSMLKNPLVPRQRELSCCTTALSRFHTGDSEVERLLRLKLRWLQACIRQPNRLLRFRSILVTWISGDYRRYGAPLALWRDLIGVCR